MTHQTPIQSNHFYFQNGLYVIHPIYPSGQLDYAVEPPNETLRQRLISSYNTRQQSDTDFTYVNVRYFTDDPINPA